MLMVPVCPECGFLDVPPGRGPPASSTALRSDSMNAVSTPYDLVRTVLESRKFVLRQRPSPDQEANQECPISSSATPDRARVLARVPTGAIGRAETRSWSTS